MSIASPFECWDVDEPPTAVFKASLLYPEDKKIGVAKCSLIGWKIFWANSLAASKCFPCGVLLIPFLFAVSDLLNSATDRFSESWIY